jgi:hypothetical protein
MKIYLIRKQVVYAFTTVLRKVTVKQIHAWTYIVIIIDFMVTSCDGDSSR